MPRPACFSLRYGLCCRPWVQILKCRQTTEGDTRARAIMQGAIDADGSWQSVTSQGVFAACDRVRAGIGPTLWDHLSPGVVFIPLGFCRFQSMVGPKCPWALAADLPSASRFGKVLLRRCRSQGGMRGHGRGVMRYLSVELSSVRSQPRLRRSVTF